MRLADLSRASLQQRLNGPGLRLRSGPWVSCIRSDIPDVLDGIVLHYSHHLVEDEHGFADFHIRIERPRGWRRWWRPQVLFRVDEHAEFAPLPGDQGFPMLEWGMNWCVSALCHQHLIIHAAVLERQGRALILPAPSGAGKSTLCAALAFGTWRLLSDELTIIDPSTLEIVPLPRPISLKNASIDIVRRHAPQATFNAVVHQTVKGSIAHASPPADAVRRGTEPARPGWVVLPQYQAGAEPRLEPMSRGEALMKLIENSFNYNVHGAEGFERLADLVEQSACYRFSYSRLEDACLVFDELAVRS